MRSKTSLFLMELIIATLFFALSSTVCIQMFIKGHQISDANEARNHAMLCAQSLMEAYEAYDGDLAFTATLYENADLDNATLTVYYTDSWQLISSENATYQATLTVSETDTDRLYHLNLSVIKLSTEKSLFAADTTFYLQEGRGSE